MKKLVLLVMVIFLLTGCSITRIDDKQIDEIVAIMEKQTKNSTNVVGKGYKYYLPMGIIRKNIDSFNEALVAEGDTYYLFIDVVGYLNKTKIKSQKLDDMYYYKKYDDKGYIAVYEGKNKYFLKFYYNYSYVETYVKKENLNKAIANITSILSTMEFSDDILLYGTSNEIVSGYEETFNITADSEREEVNFLDYEKYDKYTGPEFEIEIGNEENFEDKTTDLESDIITKDSVE